MKTRLFSTILSFIFLSNHLTAQTKITLNPDMVIDVYKVDDAQKPAALASAKKMFDEQNTIPSDLSQIGLGKYCQGVGCPATGWDFWVGGVNTVIDLGKATTISNLFYFDGFGSEIFSVEFSNDNINWQGLLKASTDQYLVWRDMGLASKTTARYIRFNKSGTSSSVLEIAIYGDAGTTGGGGINPADITKAKYLIVGEKTNLTADPTKYSTYIGTGLIAERVKVAIQGTSKWADYVFDSKYVLKPLSEVENFILKNKHLPDVPSAQEVVNSGIDLAEMNAKLLQKIEELTLYVIEQNKKIEYLMQKNK